MGYDNAWFRHLTNVVDRAAILVCSRSHRYRGSRYAASLGRFHEGFVLKRLPYVPHERNCLHLGEQRGTADVFKGSPETYISFG